MFVILVNYIKPIEMVDQYLVEHRDFLEKGYQQNYFVVSGPRNPRNGGVIISQLKDRGQLENILKQDPFWVNGIGEYEIIEFNPVKFHKDFEKYS
ncbi:MAG: YciI family protein [Gammaproteobacteria bacterium]|nr:YciI family protein [Gammaproteobacteria bacterium]